MKKLKIAQIAPIWYSLPPKKYAGIERIAYHLTESLVEKGHKVTLFASGDSKTKAKLVSFKNKALSKSKIPWSDTFFELENLCLAFKKAAQFDIIHSHIGLRAVFFQELVKTPVLHTFHNPVHSEIKELNPGLEILKLHKDTTNGCFISNMAKKLCPIRLLKSWVVYNGIDLNFFKFNDKPEDYFLWAGRVDKYKGIENAIEIAKKTKIKLYLVGKTDPEKKDYFEKEIRPNLSDKIRFLGELSQKELVRLYRGAKALIYPIEWHEPFGLVMAEAQACGTPVITFKLGSTSEVVNHGKTGFVIPFLDKNGKKNVNEMQKAVENIGSIKRKDCRDFAENNFNLEKMVENYEKIYYEILKKN